MFYATSYKANTGEIDDIYFTFEGMGVPPGTRIADLTFDPPIEYNYKHASLSEAGLEDIWSSTEDLKKQSPLNDRVYSDAAPSAVTSERPTKQAMPSSSKEIEDDTSAKSSIMSSVIGIYLPIILCLAIGVIVGYCLRARKIRK